MANQKPITRRQLLRRTGAVSGGMLLSEIALGGVAEQAWALASEGAPAAVPRRVLGKTGERIPILLQGRFHVLEHQVGSQVARGHQTRHQLLRRRLVIFGGARTSWPLAASSSAPSSVTSSGLRARATSKTPTGLERRLAESLARMKTSYVDMYYLHALEDPSELSPALLAKVSELKKQKKLKHFGFSCHHGNVAELLNLAAKTPWVDSVMFRYNFRQYRQQRVEPGDGRVRPRPASA